MACMYKYVAYVIYYTLNKKEIFDWVELVSTKISHQLLEFQKTKRFYMASYLIFSLLFYKTFKI
jgi:hypothetical protein